MSTTNHIKTNYHFITPAEFIEFVDKNSWEDVGSVMPYLTDIIRVSDTEILALNSSGGNGWSRVCVWRTNRSLFIDNIRVEVDDVICSGASLKEIRQAFFASILKHRGVSIKPAVIGLKLNHQLIYE